MTIAQGAAIFLFVAMFFVILLDKFERHIVTLASAACVIGIVFLLCMHSVSAVRSAFNFESMFTAGFWYGESDGTTGGINWSTILFIAGMMVMVEGLGQAGFFQWLCLRLAKAVHYHTVPLLLCFMCMSAFLSMFIDSITVVLFLSAVTAELARVLEFDPVPMIISEIFCANMGGAATMCGDPPNIIIGTSIGCTFFDFIANTGVIIAVGFAVCLLYFFLCFRRTLKESEKHRRPNPIYPEPSSAITNKKAFACAVFTFSTAVVLLVSHAQTRLSVALIGMIVAAMTLALTAFSSGWKSTADILRHIDYKTLLFFIGLFISVNGLEQTGVLDQVAVLIGKVSGGKAAVVIAIILWVSAIASAFVDNIPLAATMVPVIRSMAATQGIPLMTLAWTLSLGTDIGGNATPIGASANVVGTSVAAKNGHPISWKTYCIYCVPATIMVTAISMICLFVRYL
ncbi:MAG: citrate transporter [Faecalibacterium sp.]|jgi:Na+/H+ antiporter NhaD/arsenite permease-like protein|nr:citrate transporter [Faecalibacterium sp.]